MPGTAEPGRKRRALIVEGVVQGVGFRPFVYRVARELALDGVVRNAAGRVEIEVAGPEAALQAFTSRLRSEAPPRSHVERISARDLRLGPETPGPLAPGSGFAIEESVAGSSRERRFPPDIATCDACLRELFDPADRRYRYPFTNCTSCGPRATIIDALPYDRAQTSMRSFALCPDCEREYHDPADRRFHAEPVACPACGPRLAYRRATDPAPLAWADEALTSGVRDLQRGRIVAVKGLGGYHLACDATDSLAVGRLRDRKRRWAKPFAVMVRDLAAARALAEVTETEAVLLASPARPIVLLTARRDGHPALAEGVANGNPRLGLFLPYTPLHHLLLEGAERPIVLTSANLSDEPLVTDDSEALVRLAGLADAFLMHDRVIRARYDDSVVRVVAGGPRARPTIIRRARGLAPDPLPLPIPLPGDVVALAAGAELKHTFALANGSLAHISPHIGDLEDLLAHRAFEGSLAHLSRLLALEPSWVVHDRHPAYLSTQYAAAHFPADRRLAVQHHHAHVASCAAEHAVAGPVIGVAYDGLGMGDDGTLWGGEILIADLARYRRFARFGRAPMPGGGVAVRKPYRMALGYLLGAETCGADPAWMPGPMDELAHPFLERLDPREVEVVRLQIARRLNAPVASSAGRLFDAASSLLGLRDVAEFEAQAAVDLETAAGMASAPAARRPLPYRVERRDGVLVYDPRPTLRALLEGLASARPAAILAARFQETVCEVTRELVAEARRATGIGVVCLSGGVFQNVWLSATLARRLRRDGFVVHGNEQVPTNDGGISYGQSAVCAARFTAGSAMATPLWTAHRTPARPARPGPAARGKAHVAGADATGG